MSVDWHCGLCIIVTKRVAVYEILQTSLSCKQFVAAVTSSVVVQHICDIIVPFCDKSRTFGRQLLYTLRKILDIVTSQICPGAEIAAILQHC